MATVHEFESSLMEAWEPATWRDVTVLVAVSGGPDSVALLRGLLAVRCQSSGRLGVIHVNHHLRGGESDEDEHFVRSLCQELAVPCEVQHVGPVPAGDAGSLEAFVRRQRYRLLRDAAGRQGARYVATAHTADDQAETILHRIVRGTALAGLSGIPFTRRLSEWATVIRPLLGVTRQRVLAYLKDCHQSFREDSSNQSQRFTRNRIRHQLLPLLAREFNPRVVPALLRLGTRAQEAQELIDTLVEPLWEAAVDLRGPTHVELAHMILSPQPPLLARALFVRIWKRQQWPLQAMSEAKWEELRRLAQFPAIPPTRLTLPGNIQAVVQGAALTLTRL